MSTNVALYRYDAADSGLDPTETVLTPANVYATSFGKQFTTAVDGNVYAEPLYVSGVNITTGSYQGTHNVVYVATENDSLYAIDGGNGEVLWKDSFLSVSTSGVPIGSGAGEMTVSTVSTSEVGSGNISPQYGITGTPAIDANAGYLYVVANTNDVYYGQSTAPHCVYTLYKVNLSNGTFAFAVIADTTYNSNGTFDYTGQYNSGPYVDGNGDGAITNAGGQSVVYFNALRQMFRPAVELVTLDGSEQVVLSSASHGDTSPYHGWLLTYNATTLALTGVLNATPNSTPDEGGGDGGMWMGSAVACDGLGDLYFETGNGSFDPYSANFPNPSALTTPNGNPGLPIDGDYGDSFVKVQVDTVHDSPANQNVNGWGLQVVNYFTPSDQAALDSADEDLGSGAPTLLPQSAGSAAHPFLLVGGGKEGTLYLIDRGTDNTTMTMGEFHADTDDAVQEQGDAVNGILSAPPISTATCTSPPATTAGRCTSSRSTTRNSRWRARRPTIMGASTARRRSPPTARRTASCGTWPSKRTSCGPTRRRTSATRSTTSSTVSGDALPSSSVLKFSVLTVANGNVYVGTSGSLVMYGLNTPPKAPPAAPSSLAATTTTDVTAVSLSWTNNETNPANVSAFEVQRSTDGANFTQAGAVGESQTTFVDTSVAPFTTYYYRVSASNAAGTSAFTNVATVTTLGQPAVGGGDGLLGKYYAGTNSANFSNPPTSPGFTRVDPQIDFDDTGSETNWNFPNGFGDTDFEVQWTGELQAQYSEPYTFYTNSESGVELFVNGQELINDFSAHAETYDTSSPITLVAGQSYAVEIVYKQSTSQSAAAMYLYWSSQHTARGRFRRASCSPARRRPRPRTCKSRRFRATKPSLPGPAIPPTRKGSKSTAAWATRARFRPLPTRLLPPLSTWIRA